MNVVGIILMVVLGILIVWLGIDTAIYIYKKTKQKKAEKEQKNSEDTNKN